MVNRAVDTVIVFRILKILTTPWNKMKAWEFGLIDDNGKRIKSKKPKTTEEKNSFTLLHRLVFNLKRLIELLPFGKTRLASYASALFLLKEHAKLNNNQLDEEIFIYLKQIGALDEDLLEAFEPRNKISNEKEYTLIRDMFINEELEANRGDTLIYTGTKPEAKIYGVHVFRMYNIDKQSMMYCSRHDLR